MSEHADIFTLDLLDFLQTAPAVDALLDLASQPITEHNHLKLAGQLRRRFTAEQTSALIETARLRQKAAPRYGEAAQRMFFTADALEQASHPWIVRHGRSLRSAEVWDMGCGIGTDSIGLAQQGKRVIGIDLDPVRVAMAQLNAEAQGASAEFRVGDAREALTTTGAIFFDPARRSDGRRLYHVEQYQPPLSTLRRWQAAEVVVKLSPGVELDEVAEYGGRIDFISVEGELKEALLYVDPTQPQQREALLLTATGAQRFTPLPLLPERELRPPLGWLLEPDPAIIRAGLVRDLAHMVDAYQMDEQIAYLTAEQPPEHVALRAWRVRAWMPFHLKRLRAYLQAHNIGRVTVKKRATPITPEALIRQLKPRGDNACVIVLTRHLDDPIAIICDEP
ncbi:MAG: methyltransferase domain-containing protein [Aggregatilineales bacterium]